MQSDDPSDELDMCTGGGAGNLTMSDGLQANAANFNSSSACSLWDVYSNNLHGNPVIRNSGPSPFATPLIGPANVPAFPAFAYNAAAPVPVGQRTSMALPPGVYGSLNIKDNSTLTLAGGTHVFCAFSMGQNASLIDTDSTIIEVEQSFTASGGEIGPSASAHFFVRGDGATGPHDAAVSFGRGPVIAGVLWVPFGQIRLGHSPDLAGAFWAKSITSDVASLSTERSPVSIRDSPLV